MRKLGTSCLICLIICIGDSRKHLATAEYLLMLDVKLRNARVNQRFIALWIDIQTRVTRLRTTQFALVNSSEFTQK